MLSDKNREYKCQNMYWNLLKLQQKDIYAASYIRELFKTERCDSYSNLSELRKLYTDFLGPDLSTRVLEYKTNKLDEIKIAESINHYYYWSEKNIVNSLNLYNRFFYYTIEKSEQTLAALGIISTSYYGLRILKNAYNKLRKK